MKYLSSLVRLALFISALPVLLFVPARAQVVSNVLLRVLLIQTQSGQGSGFTLDVDGRQYLITAKHVVDSIKDKGTISIRENKGMVPLDVTIFPWPTLPTSRLSSLRAS